MTLIAYATDICAALAGTGLTRKEVFVFTTVAMCAVLSDAQGASET